MSKPYLRSLTRRLSFTRCLEELLGGEGRVYRGHAGYRDFIRDFGEAFAEVHWEFSDIRDLGDRLLAIGSFRARGHSGASAEEAVGVVVDYGNGLMTRVWSTLDPAEALEAAGLSE